MVGASKHCNTFASSSHRFVPPHDCRKTQQSSATSHSHIKLVVSPESRGPDPEEGEPFVRNESLQTEIEVGLAVSNRLDLTKQSLTRPRTFAEATMSTRSSRRHGSASYIESGISAGGQKNLSTSTKVTLKKKKAPKWQRLDLSASASESGEIAEELEAADDNDEAGNAAASGAPTRVNTPNPMLRYPKSSPPPISSSLSFETAKTSFSRPISPADLSTFDFKGKVKADAVEEEISRENSPEPVVVYRKPEVPYTTPVKLGEIVPAAHGHYQTPSGQLYGHGYPPYYNTPTQYDPSSYANGYTDNDPTPRVSQGQFQFPEPYNFIPLSPQDQGTLVTGSEQAELDRSDTDSVKRRTQEVLDQLNETVMASKGKDVYLKNDVFDSVEWDPELPKAPSPTQSPEPVTLKPQTVAYTTVGSLVDPTAIPQFSAPNRIQREGANRRPVPLSLMQSRHLEAGFHQPATRGPPPPLNMSNSMQYAQQLGRAGQFNNASSSGSSMSSALSGQLAEQEMDAIAKTFGGARNPQMYSGNIPSPTHNFRVTAAGGDENHPFPVRDLSQEDSRGRANSFQVQGMDKMQTLQRLSRFENPLQETALSRLAELSIKSQVTGKVISNPSGLTPYEMALHDQKKVSAFGPESLFGSQGELNRGYQFPPPGLMAPQTNPLLAAFTKSSGSQRSMAAVRPGYPQPLTAGPPGQRQFAGSQFGFPAQSFQQGQSAAQGETAGVEGRSQWDFWKTGGAFTAAASNFPPFYLPNNSYPSTKVVDTIPKDQALACYYPNGLPSDFNDKWAPITEENRKIIGEQLHPPLSAADLASQRQAQNNDWFYQGQRRYVTMSIEKHIIELEERQPNTKTNPFGTIAPPKQILHPVIPTPISIEEANKTTTAEAALPILHAAFGTLLAYAEKGPTSRSHLSRFITPAPHLIDTSPTGNDSSFGEDWGNPNFRPGQETKSASNSSSRFGDSAENFNPLRESSRAGVSRGSRFNEADNGSARWFPFQR